MNCVTNRLVIGSDDEAQQILERDQARQSEQVEVMRCPYCGFWHLVEVGSPLMNAPI